MKLSLTRYHNPKFAGFWRRFIAQAIDNHLFGCLYLLSLLPLTQAQSLSQLFTTAIILLAVAWLPLAILSLIYRLVGLSRFGQTLGSWLAGYTIINDQGRLSFSKAAFRELIAKRVSSFFLLGYLAIPYHPDHQAWHDQLTDTKAFIQQSQLGLGLLVLALAVIACLGIFALILSNLAQNQLLLQEITSLI